MKRQQFLENEWTAYPQVPSNHHIQGRVVDLRQKYVIRGSWQEILEPFDWISAKLDGEELVEIILLAPDLHPQKATFSEQTWEQHQKFQQFLTLVRQFLIQHGFAEVHTPTLAASPGTEPYLDVFSTEFKIGRRTQKFYLPTSPELHLKKVMGAYGRDIFEIRPCFRNGEVGQHHQPEFWMLEFYRAFAHLNKIQCDVENLVNYLAAQMKVPKPVQTREWSIAQLFRQRTDFELKPTTTRDELVQLARRLEISVPQNISWDDVFFLIFLEKVECQWSSDELTFIKSYPPSQAALARLTADGWGDRFEFYWKGLELGNAFHELNDPRIQRQRFQEDLAKKVSVGKESVPVDEEFLFSLERGMPPSSGIAIGLDRLFMALTDIKDISAFRLFPIKD